MICDDAWSLTGKQLSCLNAVSIRLFWIFRCFIFIFCFNLNSVHNIYTRPTLPTAHWMQCILVIVHKTKPKHQMLFNIVRAHSKTNKRFEEINIYILQHTFPRRSKSITYVYIKYMLQLNNFPSFGLSDSLTYSTLNYVWFGCWAVCKIIALQ